MADPRFYSVAGPFTLRQMADMADAEITTPNNADQVFTDVAPLSEAGPEHVAFLDNKSYVDQFKVSRAGACIVHPDVSSKAPEGMALLLSKAPYRGYARVAQMFYPKIGARPQGLGEPPLSPSATIGGNCEFGFGATVGDGAEIGSGCRIGSNTVIGAGCIIGDDCAIGAGVSLAFCVVGSRTIVHPGVRIGQDGFGFALGAEGHEKVPQLGRVIIGDDVEIGANTTIDRGTGPDTVIGEGTKIDNLVQIAHNVRLGKGCVIVSQVGISGSTEVGDFVSIGGQAGLTGHLKIGDGVQIAGQSGVMRDLEPGATVVGSPAKPMKEWFREVAMLTRLTKNKGT